MKMTTTMTIMVTMTTMRTMMMTLLLRLSPLCTCWRMTGPRGIAAYPSAPPIWEHSDKISKNKRTVYSRYYMLLYVLSISTSHIGVHSNLRFPKKRFLIYVLVLNSGWVRSRILGKIYFQNKDENVETTVFPTCSVHSVFDRKLNQIESSPRLRSGCSGICNTQKQVW